MARGQLIALSNPVSAAREAEFNKWYNEVHIPELVGLPGFESATRYRVSSQGLPQKETPEFRYVAVYEIADMDAAMKAMATAAAKLTQTDSSGERGVAALAHVTFQQSK
jgi:hypothetical protein